MRILCIDFETMFDKDYTLKKLTTEAYIRDPRFEALGCGFKWLDAPKHPYWEEGRSLPAIFRNIEWDNVGVLCHHAQFDGLILSHHYGVRPAFWFDTLSMARMVHGNHVSAALGSLAALYGLPAKSVPYDAFRGKHWADLDAGTRQALAEGCLHDVDLTIDIFKRMLNGFPQEELRVIDQTVRMFVEPQLVGDAAAFRRLQGEEWTRKNETLMDLGVSTRQLQSSEQFCLLLEAEGVEVEVKATAAGQAPAIAKTDQFMKELLDDANPRVAALAAARLDVRSTIDETRAGRLAAHSERGPLCVYLAYAGAHTLRWSGGDKLNFQNLPRTGGLREAVHAGPGRKLIVIDLSQIEARLLNHVAGQADVVETFRVSGSLQYIKGAEELYGRKIDKKTDVEEYIVGKKRELGCGYGMGALRFRQMVFGDSGIRLSEDFSALAVRGYRESHPKVVDFWRECDDALHAIANKQEFHIAEGLLSHYDDGLLHGPNGSWMTYVLEWDAGERSWRRKTRSGWRKIWGGGLCIAGDALVLSARGWVRLDAVLYNDLIWDGIDFVSHQGLISRGERYTIAVDGVRMTPDHEVLTADTGWKRAVECDGYFRETVRVPDRFREPSFGWKTSVVGTPLSVWRGRRARRTRATQGDKAGLETKLRVYGGAKRKAPYDPSPRIRSVAVYVRSLPFTFTSSLEKLWGAGHNCLRALAGALREFLGRHGIVLRPGVDARACQQRSWVCARELPVGDLQGASGEPAVSAEKVYDLMNCGPRRRFVVAGEDGPFIVHNCENFIQYLARLVTVQAALRVQDKYGYRPVLSVHDELVWSVPEDEAERLYPLFLAEMKATPAWLPGAPIDAEGAVMERYGK